MTCAHEQHRRRILIVDGDRAYTDVVAQALVGEGFGVEVPRDGRAILEHIRDLPPAAVILDVTSTGMDGFSILRQLRNDPIGRGLPVMATSSAWRTHEKCRAIGFSQRVAPTVVLPKPFVLADLADCFRRLHIASWLPVRAPA